ncbi:type VI secretion protein ImpA [Burkholderia lata]|uniref:type VI secretion system Vgr family protein n=1 Tax=Burkholderia lata (strain ATCC 17760 / DSM 23089 / LMG 22485 / NCIMB 9086 / R18194 / 383) TaxID=482957 RepID=UPI001453B12B|nr:type VI secretion system Vgr family protein [Burkholderia lata]VWC59343.1 type VI secretion protein ImpA [Burkholderia lata]
MYVPTQSRVLTISGAALPGVAGQSILLPVRLHGEEALGNLYEFTLELKTLSLPTLPVYEARDRIKPDELVGTELTIAIEFDGKGTFIPGVPGGAGLGNEGAGKREIVGLITELTFTGEDDRCAYYEMSVRPWLWLTTLNRENRIFQNKNVVEITGAVLGSSLYPFKYELRLGAIGLKGVYPTRDYVRQVWESDFEFLTRLWCEWGIYYFMDGSTLVLCDSPGSHKPHGNMYDTILYHARAGTRVDEEHVHRLSVSRVLTAGAVSLIDYDPTQSRAILSNAVDRYSDVSFSNAEHYGWGDYSQPLAGTMGLSGTPNNQALEAQYLAGVRVDAERCRSLRAKGRGNLRGMATGHTLCLEGHPQTRTNAEYLVVAATIDIRNNDETTGGEPYHCATDFVLQPARAFFRNSLKRKPHCGPETAVVVGPENQPMWIDGYARVKIQFIWDRLGERNENSSCWVRVSSPWQGSGFGFVALPRIGQEVTVSYHEGDVDKPYVSDRQVNQFNQPPWELPKNQALMGWRSMSLTGRQSNQVVVDDTPGKLQVQVASDYAQSRLVLGYNTRIEGDTGRQQERGVGFEMATEAHGVVRANRGMLVTTEAREGASAPAKDMGETVARLTQASELHEELAQLAQRHNAQEAGVSQRDATQAIKMQTEAIKGGVVDPSEDPFPEMSRPDIVLASASGIGMSAAQGVHIASQGDHAVTAGRDVSVSSGRSLIGSIKGAISLFAAKLGIRLVAAQGKVEIQAQDDVMALAALKDLTVTSLDGKIVLNASKEIWIGVGGSFIRITADGIVNGTTGQIQEKCAKWSKAGADSVRIPFSDSFGKIYEGFFKLHWEGSDQIARYQPYRITRADGSRFEGVTNAEGETALHLAEYSETLKIEIL